MKCPVYSWDFETTVDSNDCRVWAWASVGVSNTDDVQVNNNIDSFMQFISERTCKGYFHNLKFDGEFILSWLLRHNFKHKTNPDRLKPNEFYTMISDGGQFYKIIIRFDKTKCTILDSFKLLPFKVEKIAKDFGLPISKLSIDYVACRKVGHVLTDEEREYVVTDAKIIAMALKIMFDNGLTRLTIGSNALNSYKKSVGNNFKHWFPTPSNDAFIRKSYKGGFTYANPKFVGKDIGCGIVLDVNSLYPSVMADENNPYPVGNGVYYEGRYNTDEDYPLYVQRIITRFKVKPEHLPTIQVKNAFSSFVPTEYLTDSGDELVELTLTCVDLALFLDHYDVEDLTYVDGYKYMAMSGLFTEYIVYWTEVKIKAKRDGNASMYTIAKLMLNNLYGKFSSKAIGYSKIPYIDNGVVKYRLGDKEEREPVYIPVGTFVTAYARNVTIRAAQKVYYRFLYADTDSLHLVGTEIPKELNVDDYKLGAWKHESTFVKARYLRAKTYIENEIVKEVEGIKLCSLKITVAGMPPTCYSQVDFDNFNIGAVYSGKLTPRHVAGGIVLEETTFKISA